MDPPPPYTPLLIPLLSPSTSASITPTIGTVVQLQTTLQALASHARLKQAAVVRARAQVEALVEREREGKPAKAGAGAGAGGGGRKDDKRDRAGSARVGTPTKAAGGTGSGVKVERATTPSLITGTGSPLTPVPSNGSKPSTPTTQPRSLPFPQPPAPPAAPPSIGGSNGSLSDPDDEDEDEDEGDDDDVEAEAEPSDTSSAGVALAAAAKPPKQGSTTKDKDKKAAGTKKDKEPPPALATAAAAAAAAGKDKKKRKRAAGQVISDGEEGSGPERKKDRPTPAPSTAAAAAAPSGPAVPAGGGRKDELPKFKKKERASREPSAAAATATAGRAQTPPPPPPPGPSGAGSAVNQRTPTPGPATAVDRKKAATTPQPPGGSAAAPTVVVVPKIKLSISSATRANSPPTAAPTPLPDHPPLPAAAAAPPAAANLHAPAPSLGSIIDFRLPLQTRSLVPPRPALPAPLPSLPLTQSEVQDDFTQAKAPPTQLAFATFLTAAEAFTRGVGEEDLAFLKGYKDEDLEPYIVPPLGQHWTHQFAEEDRMVALGLPYVPPPILPLAPPPAVNGGAGSSADPSSSATMPAPAGSSSTTPAAAAAAQAQASYRPRRADYAFDPLEALSEEVLVDESRSLGPVSERVVGGLLDAKGERLEFPVGGGSGGAGEREREGKEDGSVGRLEERVRKELQLVGLLGDEPIDWSQRADDEISTSLRQCQKLLAAQAATNTARKAVLLSIAKDRLAFAEYQQCLDGLDRTLESAWAKRQKIAARQQKRRQGTLAPGTSVRISAKEKERDDKEREQQRLLMATVRTAMERRRLLVEHVGGLFRDEEDEEPGRFFGLPKTSVYEGLVIGSEGMVAGGMAPGLEGRPMTTTPPVGGGEGEHL